MIWKTEDMLDLNVDNVRALFLHCAVPKSGSRENSCLVNFLSPAHNTTVSNLCCYQHRLEEKKDAVKFLLGQFKVVHSGKTKFFLQDGFLKYDGTMWTKDKVPLFCLYYLAVGMGLLPWFEPSADKNGAYECQLTPQHVLKKTISPNDSAFQEFCEELEYREMLPSLIEEKKKYYNSEEYKKRKADALGWALLTLGEEKWEHAMRAQERLENFETDIDFLSALSKKEAEKTRATLKLYAVCE